MGVLVEGGPADGREVSPKLGPRWPWMLMGHYGLAYPLFWYVLRDGRYIPQEETPTP